jgi:hypothetical protein
MRKTVQRITPFLWFDNQAEDAANVYVSILKNSRMGSVAPSDEAAAKCRRKTPGVGHDGGIRARWARVHGVERRAALPVYRGDILCREPRDAGRSGPPLC